MQARSPHGRRTSGVMETSACLTMAQSWTFDRAQGRGKPGDKDGKTRFPFAPGQLVIPITREECVPQVG